MKAIIHIGFHKTGSTALQKGLYNSRELLLENKILYPDLGTFQHLGLIPIFKESPESYVRSRLKDLDREEALEWGRSQASALDSQIQESNADLCILSSEGFSRLSKPELQRFKAFLDCRFNEYVIAAYIRDPSDGYSSVLQQDIRSGNRRPVLKDLYPWTFKSRNRELLEKLLDVFKLEILKVFKFSRDALIDGDIVCDFTFRLNIPKVVTSTRHNTSLSSVHVAALYWLNHSIPKWNSDGSSNRTWVSARTKIIKSITRLNESRAYSKFKIDDSRWADVITVLNSEDNRWIHREFFDGEDLKPENLNIQLPSCEEEQHHLEREFEEYITSPLSMDMMFLILLEIVQESVDADLKVQRHIEKISRIKNKFKIKNREIFQRFQVLKDKNSEIFQDLQALKEENIYIKNTFMVKQILYVTEKLSRIKKRFFSD
ncbi:MAG: hypothetical protein AAGM36_08270 [Cyanobacteria bacterium J06597_1]